MPTSFRFRETLTFQGPGAILLLAGAPLQPLSWRTEIEPHPGSLHTVLGTSESLTDE